MLEILFTSQLFLSCAVQVLIVNRLILRAPLNMGACISRNPLIDILSLQLISGVVQFHGISVFKCSSTNCRVHDVDWSLSFFFV